MFNVSYPTDRTAVIHYHNQRFIQSLIKQAFLIIIYHILYIYHGISKPKIPHCFIHDSHLYILQIML